MTVRNVTGNIKDFAGNVRPNTAFDLIPAQFGFGDAASSVILGDVRTIVSDASGNVDFSTEEGKYALRFETLDGRKSAPMTVDSDGPWDIGRLVRLAGGVITDPVLQAALQAVEDAEAAADRAEAAAEIYFGTMTTASSATIPNSVEAVYLSGREEVGDSGVSAVFGRVLSEPSHTAKFQSADGAWWERVVDENGVAAPWYGPCDTPSNRRQTVLDAYTHWSTLTTTVYGLAHPTASNAKLFFPAIPGLSMFDVGSAVNIVTVGTGCVIEGSGPLQVLQGVNIVFEDHNCDAFNLWIDGDNYTNTPFTFGTANGRADECKLYNFQTYQADRPIWIADAALCIISNGINRDFNDGFLLKSYDFATNPEASGNVEINHVGFWKSRNNCLNIEGFGELKFNNCVFYDAEKPNIVIGGSASTGERVLQMYFTDCTSTIGHDDLTDRAQAAITSVTDNGAGKVRVNFSSGAMPYLFEGQRLVQFDFSGVYSDGLYTISNVTAASVDIEDLTYSATTTGTVYHPGWDLVIDNQGAPVLPTTETYDLYFTGGNINRAYVGRSSNVVFTGTSIPLQLYADTGCLSLTRIGTALGRYSTAEDNVPISGPGKWAEISNFNRTGIEYGSIMRSPDATATYSNGLPSLINSLRATNLGTFAAGSKFEIATKELVVSNTPRFSARLSATASNVTGNNTTYTVVFDDEIYDNSGDYDTGTGVFTAPQDGLYQFTARLQVRGMGTSATRILMQLVSSTGEAWEYRVEGGYINNFEVVDINEAVEMSLGDTMKVNVSVNGLGADTVDILGAAGATNYSTFTGVLVG